MLNFLSLRLQGNLVEFGVQRLSLSLLMLLQGVDHVAPAYLLGVVFDLRVKHLHRFFLTFFRFFHRRNFLG